MILSQKYYRVSQKNVLSWKNGHNYLQNHPKCKCWGCFGKFRIFDICYQMGTEIFKIEEEMTEKMNDEA